MSKAKSQQSKLRDSLELIFKTWLTLLFSMRLNTVRDILSRKQLFLLFSMIFMFFRLLIRLAKVIASKKDFDFALDRISMGVGRTNMFITDADKLKTAYHEGGHTITALLTKESTPLHKVTILPRGGALGFVRKR